MATATVVNNLKHKTEKILPLNYPIVKISEPSREVRLSSIIPFRVKFTAFQIQVIGIGNAPGIGLQVIDYSNYIF